MSDAFDDHMAAALEADIAKLDALAYRERRERIATAALQGLLASADMSRGGGGGVWDAETAASLSVDFADALIAALEQPIGGGL